MKRKWGGSVTGGTRDIKPQFLTIVTSDSAANQYVVEATPIPTVRPTGASKSAIVMEMLSIDYYPYVDSLDDSQGTLWCFLSTSTTRSSGGTATTETLENDIGDVRSQGIVLRRRQTVTAGTEGIGAVSVDYPWHYDFTDENGNGMLWGLDFITLVSGNLLIQTQTGVAAKLKYRWVEVGITEYLGIVQQQSQ